MLKLIIASFVFTAFADAYYLDPTSSRIVGGSQAEKNEWPWQVSLQSRSFPFFPWSHFCGGSLIAPDYILTAAHCVDGQSAGSIRVVVGLHEQSNANGAETLTVSRIIMHPEYSSREGGFPNDIALLLLSSEVTNIKAEIIPLPRSTMSFFGNPDCWITGWGKTSASSGTSEVLMEAQMDVIDNGDCAESWTSVQGANVYDTHICIEAEGKSACNGDSGGPLVCREDGQYVLAGATSWGISTCEGFPSVYVRVSKYLGWINSEIERY